MVTRPIVTVVICVGFFLILQALIPKAMALRNPSNVDRFMPEGHRTHKRKNYMVQKTRDNEIMENFKNRGVTYDVEPYDPDRNPEELSAFIVDYANMIRNDVILLDKSVETRTRKRGNIKVKKYNQVLTDPPCTCEPNVDWEILGNDVFPPSVEIRNCSKSNSCRLPFICKENLYNITILKLKQGDKGDAGSEDDDNEKIHSNLTKNWYAVRIPISVGCSCVSGYVENI